MYKDRLTKWRISKNVKASDIKTIAKKDDAAALSPGAQPEFYTVGDRLIRADRLQQAMQRRATVARRAMKNDSRRSAGLVRPTSTTTTTSAAPFNNTDLLHSSYSTPLLVVSISTPEALRIPESILLQSRGYISGTFEAINAKQGAGGPVDIKLEGPAQRCRLAFEETLANLNLMQGLDRVAFMSLDGAFDLIRPCLLDHDPQFLVVFLQIMSLCLWFNRPEIMHTILAYLHDLSSLVLGVRHPITVICRDFRTADVDTRRRACRLAAEAAWHQFRGYLYPFRIDSFVHLTGSYADVLDSLGQHDEAESFLRYVVDSLDSSTSSSSSSSGVEPAAAPVDRRLDLELHLVMCLRRRDKYPEALRRLARVRRALLDHEPQLMRQSEERTAELTYQALRISALCECDGGDVERGRDLFREAFELMQERKGRYSPRTTRALRDLVRYSEPDEALMKDLEDRLAKFSLQTENFL